MGLFAHHGQGADRHAFKHPGPTIDPHPSGDRAGVEVGFFANDCPVPNDGALEIRFGADRDVIANDRAGLDRGAGANSAVVTNQNGGHNFGAIIDRGIFAHPQTRRNHLIGEIQFDLAVEGRIVGFAIGVQMPHIAPIALGNIAINGFSFGQQQGK